MDINILALIEKLFVTIGALVVIVLVVEFIPDWLKSIRRRSRGKAKIDLDYRNQADVFKTLDWGPEYFYEYWSAVRNLQWLPYVYGRCRPFRGKFINVDDQGFRKSWTSVVPKQEKQMPMQVFVFGGSTCWGMGARDAFTVPSEISKILNEKMDGVVDVLNLAENGHVATQSLLTLMMEIRRGNIPDLVVFYDGINDAFSAYQNNIAGIPQNEYNRRAEFNVLHKDMRHLFYKAAVPILFRRTLRFIDNIAGLFVSEKKNAEKKNTENARPHNPELPRDVLKVYTDIIYQVQSYGRKYGFDCCFFWQPSIYTKKNLTAYEESEKQINIRYAEILKDVNSKIGEFPELRPENGFYDIHRVFDDVAEGVYLDFAHVSENGNRILAEAMVPEIMKRLEARQDK